MKRLPSLDGLRAIAIGLVLIEHLRGTAGFAALTVFDDIELGRLGVRIFFVISGFLITSLLVQESRATGRVDLWGFYLRRAFRIFPAFYTYVIAVAILDAMGVVATRSGDYLAAITYTANYHHDHGWPLGHIWSLSVEEQFYVVWPAIVLIVGRRWCLGVALGALVMAPAIRLASDHLHGATGEGIGETFQTICDAIATGCVLALVRDRLDVSAGYLRWLRSPAWLVAPILMVVIAWVGVSVIGQTLINVLIAVTIDRVVRIPDDLIGRALNRRLLVWLGAVSYSLYLWQQLFIDRKQPGILHAFPVSLILSLAAAYLSYTVIEQPFLQLRSRLQGRRDAAHRRSLPRLVREQDRDQAAPQVTPPSGGS